MNWRKETRTCKTCGKNFVPKRYDARFCSISCGLKSHPSQMKGKKMALGNKVKRGKNHHRWIDGRSYSPLSKRVYAANWQRLKREVGGSHTEGEWETLKAQYNWTCPCCKRMEPDIKLTRDHIVPLSRGGSNNIENIQPLCRVCNCKKWTKTIKFDIP